MRWAQLAAGLILCGCATVDQPLQTDRVRDAETAIAIGKVTCTRLGGDVGGHWTATFSLGVWDVEQFNPNGNPKWYKRLKIWADNGKTDKCEEMVVVT
jgi:hypothetical protein